MTTIGKRSRASTEQINHLVDFMVENPELASGRFNKLHGKEQNNKIWSNLMETLNSLGGTVKTVEQWQTVWRDLKSRTSIKLRERKKLQAQTGNKTAYQEPITPIEEKIISIVGSHYIEGHECVLENVPMNEELQLQLEHGEEFKFDAPPSTPKSVLPKPTTPASRTPRASKRKREENESETESKFLDIAAKQADAMKLLAESSSGNAEAMKSIGEGLKAAADAINNLANVIKTFMTAPQ